MTTKTQINRIIKPKIKSALQILMDGRTFYDGYFDRPFENLSRIDQATVVLLEVSEQLKEVDNGV